MKNKLSIFILSLITAVMFTACGDDDSEFSGPYRLNIAGPSEVSPESTAEYTIGDYTNSNTYTWSVTGASIVGSSTGNTIEVSFDGVGEAVITVTDGGVSTGTYTVEIAEVEPSVSVTLNGAGVLRNGQADTVFFEFAAPLNADPSSFAMVMDSSANNGGNPFISGSLGALTKVDDMNYYAIYTAGEGNGTPEALLQDLISTATYGEVTIDSAYVDLYKVDNLAPVATFDFSSTLVNDGTVLDITVTFNEMVMAADPAMDSSILIHFSGAVPDKMDTLKPTDNPMVYTTSLEITGGGNGILEIEIDNLADLAGNTSMLLNLNVFVDNMAPVLDAGVQAETGYANMVFALIEGGLVAGEVSYAVFASGSVAPADISEFENGIISGSQKIDGAAGSVSVALEAGDYVAFFVGKDEAGNMTAMIDRSFTVN